MIRLNPNDNQKVRYLLAGFLLALDRDDDLIALLDQYAEDESVYWAYNRVLVAFRKQGDTIETCRLLKAATKNNKYVPAYLTGRKDPGDDDLQGFLPSDEIEAQRYLRGGLSGWRSTPGAVAWLRANDPTRKKQQAEPPPRGPLTLVKKWLMRHLPSEENIWQAEFRQMPNWVFVAGEPYRPWIVVVFNRDEELVIGHHISDHRPTSSVLWDALAQAMQHPVAGSPHRPCELQVRENEQWEELRTHLQEIGVELVVESCLDDIESIMEEMREHMGGKPEPGLLDMPGMEPEQVEGFYQAAAAFFRQSPWKRVGYEATIRIECERFHSGPWYAVLMGQSGLTLGMALYENLDTLNSTWRDDYSEKETNRETVGLNVSFEEEWNIPVADLEAAQTYGWEVARPDAYPDVMHKDRGMAFRQPLTWELELLEGCLRAIPEFLNRREQDDTTQEEFRVSAAAKELRLVLSWVVDGDGEEAGAGEEGDA